MLRTVYYLRKSFAKRLEQALTRAWYRYLSHMDRQAHMLLMNYGWADLEPETPQIPLDKADEPNRYSLQLYHHVAGSVALRGKRVLEVGCGRGGAAAYLARYLQPEAIVGIDLTGAAIRFCNRHCHVANLSFVRGNTESLDFPNGSFDAVVNVESSHCYRSMDRFLHGVCRVLKPNGDFLFADDRSTDQLEALRTQIGRTGFTLLTEQRITSNVLRALDLDNTRKQQLIQAKVPRLLQEVFNEFGCMKGTRGVYAQFASGKRDYVSFVFQKQPTPSS